ncbi:hypothetical protein ABT120_61430 [Nonomuraea angiospora]|uniref:hypothetical protein n=1 Tax=Nonomuraea angiospora TaxID=46172 RepID=UPI0033258309
MTPSPSHDHAARDEHTPDDPPVDHRQAALNTLEAAGYGYEDRRANDDGDAAVMYVADQMKAVVHALLYIGDQIARRSTDGQHDRSA